MIHKTKKVFELAIAFWIGIGLMSMINIIKITYTRQILLYDWIMFGVSVLFVIICLIILSLKSKKGEN